MEYLDINLRHIKLQYKNEEIIADMRALYDALDENQHLSDKQIEILNEIGEKYDFC